MPSPPIPKRAPGATTPRAVREREVLRISTSFGSGDAKREIETARKEALEWAKTRAGGSLPPEAWDCRTFERRASGRDCAAVRIAEDDDDIWAVRTSEPDPRVARRVWTAEIVVGRPEKGKPFLSLRLLVSPPEEHARIAPETPEVLGRIANECDLRLGNERLIPEPRIVGSDDDAERLIASMLDPKRRTPLVVLSVPVGATSPYRPLLDPHSLAQATFGLAGVFVLPARFAWSLTGRFGKRLSVFGGAARMYLPGFAEDSDPYDHELILATRLSSDAGVRRASADLRRDIAEESLRQRRLERDVLSFSAVRARLPEAEDEGQENEIAAAGQRPPATSKKNDASETPPGETEESRADRLEKRGSEPEREDAGESASKTEDPEDARSTNGSAPQDREPDSGVRLPKSWAEFSDWCEENLSGRVLLSPRARNEVRNPKYRDVETAARGLLWLADDYREARMSGGDPNLRRQIANGVKNDRCGADSFEFSWRGQWVKVAWHIKGGGNTRDPLRCLRIYYFWDDADRQVVVASMPAHIRTGAT